MDLFSVHHPEKRLILGSSEVSTNFSGHAETIPSDPRLCNYIAPSFTSRLNEICVQIWVLIEDFSVPTPVKESLHFCSFRE